MKISVWQGFHSPDILGKIRSAWEREELLILAPPKVELDTILTALPKNSALFPEKPIYGIFSTGTTGQKLVLYSKKNIVSSLEGILSLFDSNRVKEIFCYPQPFHTFGLILGYCHSFLYDRRLIAPSGEYSKIAHALWKSNATSGTMTLGTPTHFKDLIQAISGDSFSQSYTCIIGAARVERSLWLDVREKLQIEAPSIGYGATEASPGVTHLAPGEMPIEDGEIGRFLPHVKACLTDNGVEFEGAGVCLALFENNQLTFPKRITLSDRLEKRTSDGKLLYRGRQQLILNRGGEKFSLELIESKIRETLGIHTCCVSVPDSRLTEELGIIAETTPDKRETIYKLLRDSFGRDFTAKNFICTPSLPINSSCKTDRHASKNYLTSQLDA